MTFQHLLDKALGNIRIYGRSSGQSGGQDRVGFNTRKYYIVHHRKRGH